MIGRRAGRVNIVDRDSSTYDEEEQQQRRRLKVCPKDGREMVWVDEVPSYFCPKCGYSSHGAPLPASFNNITDDTDTTVVSEEEEEEAQSLSHKVSLGETTDSTSADSNNLFIMPLSKTRFEEQEKQLKQKRFPGLDKDTDILEQKGYTLIDSTEYIPNTDDNTTVSSEDLKRQTERRTRGRW